MQLGNVCPDMEVALNCVPSVDTSCNVLLLTLCALASDYDCPGVHAQRRPAKLPKDTKTTVSALAVCW